MARARRYEEDDDDYDSPVRRREDDYDDDRPSRRYEEDEDDRPSRRRRDDYDDDDEEDEDYRPSRRGFRCPYCRSRERPNVSSQVSPAGWVVFVIMILFCVPLCFIGLLMTEETRTCCDCGRQVS